MKMVQRMSNQFKVQYLYIHKPWIQSLMKNTVSIFGWRGSLRCFFRFNLSGRFQNVERQMKTQHETVLSSALQSLWKAQITIDAAHESLSMNLNSVTI